MTLIKGPKLVFRNPAAYGLSGSVLEIWANETEHDFPLTSVLYWRVDYEPDPRSVEAVRFLPVREFAAA